MMKLSNNIYKKLHNRIKSFLNITHSKSELVQTRVNNVNRVNLRKKYE
jgi:hypothetical protein